MERQNKCFLNTNGVENEGKILIFHFNGHDKCNKFIHNLTSTALTKKEA